MKQFFTILLVLCGLVGLSGKPHALSADEARLLIERFVVNEPLGAAPGSDRVFRWQGAVLVGVAATGAVSDEALSSVRNATEIMASFRAPLRTQDGAGFSAANFRVFLVEHLAWQQNSALVEMLAPHLYTQPISSAEASDSLFGESFDATAAFGRQCVSKTRSDGRRLTDAYLLVDASLPPAQLDACIAYGFLRNLGLLGPEFSLETVIDATSSDGLTQEARTAVWMLYAPGVEPGMSAEEIVLTNGQ